MRVRFVLAVALVSAIAGGLGATLIIPRQGEARQTALRNRPVVVRNGEHAIFAGTNWTCYSNFQSAPAGIAGINTQASRQTVFCRYLIGDGGCPFVELANPYLWIGDTLLHSMRRTPSGAYYIKTHFGCD